MERERRGAAVLIALAATAALALGIAGCGGSAEEQAAELTGGHPSHGRELVRRYGCPTCHTIPGIAGGDGNIGPPLDGIAKRAFLAGKLPNNPENMLRWIRDPQGISPGTAMPQMGLSEQDGKDIAAFLYTLR